MIVEILLGYWLVVWFLFVTGFVLAASVVFCLTLLLIFVVKRVSMVLRSRLK